MRILLESNREENAKAEGEVGLLEMKSGQIKELKEAIGKDLDGYLKLMSLLRRQYENKSNKRSRRDQEKT